MVEKMTGLFGPSPYEVQQARNQQMNTSAENFAQMNATQRGVMGMYKGGAGLAGMGAGMMGMVDPAVAQAQQNKQELSGLDPQTPESILATAQKVTDPKVKMQLIELAQKRREAITKQKLDEAHAKYYEREKDDPTVIRMLEIANDPNEPEAKRKTALEWLAKNGPSTRGGTGRTQTINTSIGILNFDPYAKKYTYADGSDVPSDMLRGMTPIGNDPVNAAAVATAKAGGTAVGKTAGEAMIHLPRVDSDIALINNLGDKLFNHAGYKNLVGAGFPGMKYLQGSSVPGAKAFVDQLNGIAGLMARQELRGQGQITENEAAAALSAFSRMNTATSEKDFKEAYNDFVKRVESVRDILRQQAGMKFDQRPFQAQPIATQTNTQTAPAASNTSSVSGYIGGSKGSAAEEQIRMMQAELVNPNIPEADKAGIRREIARLSGNKSVAVPMTRKTKSGVTYTMEP